MKGLIISNTIDNTLARMLDAKVAIHNNASAIIAKSTRIVSESGEFNGIKIVQPCDDTIYEGGCWIRDYYYGCLRGCIDSNDIKNVYYWYKSHIETSGDNAYQVPDVIYINGTPNWVGDRPALDGNPFMVFTAILYYKISHDEEFIQTELPYLAILMENSQKQDGLAYNSEDPNRVGVGFQDSIHMTGKLAYCSVLYYDACIRAISVCEELNLDSSIFASIANGVKNTFIETFWDGEYLKASTGICSGQFDIMAACYAVSCGLVDGEIAEIIVNKVYSYNDELQVNGFYKYVPKDYYYNESQVWESGNQQWSGVDIYQWGGFWTIGSPHILDAICKIKGKEVIKPMIDSMVEYVLNNGLYEECRNLDGSWRNALRYVPTVSAVEICYDIYLGNNWYY